MQSKQQYFLNRALQAVTVGLLLAYFTNNLLIGLGFALVVFGLFWLYSRSPRFPGFASDDAGKSAETSDASARAVIWGLGATLVLFSVLYVVQTRYILPFNPGGFALIAGVLVGVLVLYLQRRKPRK